MAVLMREAIGGSLRRARTEGRRTLREVSRRARVSLGYLSEVERGRKEASSELLAAICDALDVSLPDVLRRGRGGDRPIAGRRRRGGPLACPSARSGSGTWICGSRSSADGARHACRSRRCRCAGYGPLPERVSAACVSPGRPDIGLRMIPDIVHLGWKSGPHRCHDGVRSR